MTEETIHEIYNKAIDHAIQIALSVGKGGEPNPVKLLSQIIDGLQKLKNENRSH